VSTGGGKRVKRPDEEIEAPMDDETPVAGPPRRSRRWNVLGLVAAVLVLISGAGAWWYSASDDTLDAAEARDVVLVQAQRNVETLNTLDYRKVDEGLKAWTAATTGTLGDQLRAIGPEDRKLLADQKKISTGKVVDAAVVDLDDRTATVIVSVEITVRDGEDTSADPTVKRNRFSADLALVKGRWKLENLQQVAVSLS